MKNLSWILMIVVLSLSACQNSTERLEDVGNYSFEWSDEAPVTEQAPGTYGIQVHDKISANNKLEHSGDIDFTSAGEDIPQPQQPHKAPDKIIKTGNLGMGVGDYNKSLEKIRTAVTQAQGYISNENEQRNNFGVTNTITIRVTNDRFDMLMESLAGEADKLNYKNIDLLDVTEEFTDLEARLKTKKEVEQRYRDILKTAKTVKDILAVEEELRQVREEIEVVEGRLKYLSDKVAYSTINVNITQEFDYVPPTANQAGFGTRILNALIGGWNGLQGFVVGLVYVWPFLIILGVFIWMVRRWWKRRQARKAMYS